MNKCLLHFFFTVVRHCIGHSGCWLFAEVRWNFGCVQRSQSQCGANRVDCHWFGYTSDSILWMLWCHSRIPLHGLDGKLCVFMYFSTHIFSLFRFDDRRRLVVADTVCATAHSHAGRPLLGYAQHALVCCCQSKRIRRRRRWWRRRLCKHHLIHSALRTKRIANHKITNHPPKSRNGPFLPPTWIV